MKSRVHPKYKTRYRVTGRRHYERGLGQRARSLDAQESEAAAACNVLNQMRGLGWPTSEKVAS